MSTAAKAWLVALGLLGLFALPAPVHAQQPRVSVEVQGLLGQESLGQGRWSTVLVKVHNPTRRTYRGTLVATVTHWNRPDTRHRRPLDLPPETTRRARMTLFLQDTGNTVRASYVTDGGREIAGATTSPSYGAGQRIVAVLADPPRLRNALAGIEAPAPSRPGHATPSGPTAVPVGVVPTDPLTGDPLLPTQPVGWSMVQLLVASGPMLARIPEPDKRALEGWLRSGGRMLVFPRTDADLRDPFLRELVGEVQRCEDPAAEPTPLVPFDVRSRCLTGDADGFTTQPFGGSVRVGFGHVFIATWDGASRPWVDLPATRKVVRAIAEQYREPGFDEPIAGFGVGNEQTGGGGWMYGGSGFPEIRAELDPNESFRPALALVALVLVVYVFLVGPVNFAFVGKRNRPTLALATTPAAAAACLGVMLAVGYLGKGTTMRYRAVELVETVEGAPSGPALRYSGLFLTRPASFDLAPVQGAMVRPVRASSADHASWVDHGGERPVLREVRGRLWETIFVREDRVARMGRGIRFVRDGGRITAVVNDTPHALRGAFVLDTGGQAYDVGSVPAGGRAAVPTVAAFSLPTPGVGYWGRGHSEQVATQLEIPERVGLVQGLVSLADNNLVTPRAPTLYARWNKPPRPDEAERFVPESEVRIVRVVPRLEGRAVHAPSALPGSPARPDMGTPPSMPGGTTGAGMGRPDAGAAAGSPTDGGAP